MNRILVILGMLLLMATCGLMEQQDANDKARIKRENIECKKCHYCSLVSAKRVCADYKMGIGKPNGKVIDSAVVTKDIK